MADLLLALGIVVIAALGIYLVLELYEVVYSIRAAHRQPVSGTESAVGRSAVISCEFSKSVSGALLGRIKFDGEDWKAEYVGDEATVPRVGERVQIVEIEISGLLVRVE